MRPQEAALLGITAVWGSTFLLVHWAMEHSGPWFFVGIRFLVAGLISVAIFWRSLRGMRWRDIGAGGAIGVMIYLGYGLQTLGLQTIDSSTSAFITAMYVPLVPLAQWAVFRKRPPAMAFVGAGLGEAGHGGCPAGTGGKDSRSLSLVRRGGGALPGWGGCRPFSGWVGRGRVDGRQVVLLARCRSAVRVRA